MQMIPSDLELIRLFAREQSQDAFTELVNRHLDLVHSAALRQVRSPELAEEISQTVFTNLARTAASLKPDTHLTAWLYQVTRHTAIDVIRREARRQAREQIAYQMSELNDRPSDWSHIEHWLDEAMEALPPVDRTAVLLRYFENKSLREVGTETGTSEDAAQKRVARAVDRLREELGRRKVAVGTAALVGLVSANAVQAAPVGLATSVATGSLATFTALTSSTVLAKTFTLAMTTTQKILLGTTLAAAIAVGVYQTQQNSKLRQQVQILQQQQEQASALTNELQQLQKERDRARNAAAALANQDTGQKKGSNEVLKLRGEVGRLRQEKNEIAATSGLSKITADPEARKAMRDQQKMAMSMIYKGLSDKLKLPDDQKEQFNELLADHIMNNVSNVTAILRDKPSPEQMNQIFAAQEADLQSKVQSLVGADGLTQFQDYSRNLLSKLSADQFKTMMTGDDAAKTQKAAQMSQILQEESAKVLSGAGLPADFQLIPTLNFQNIASEEAATKNLQLLDEVYQNFSKRADGLLSPEELAKFQEFKALAIKNNKMGLLMNRNLMAPIGN